MKMRPVAPVPGNPSSSTWSGFRWSAIDGLGCRQRHGGPPPPRCELGESKPGTHAVRCPAQDPSGDAPVALIWSPILDWDNEGWRPQAACRDVDPKVFFPVGRSGPAVSHIGTAQAVPFVPRQGSLPAVRPRDEPGSRSLGRQGRGRAARTAPGRARPPLMRSEIK